MALQEEFEKQGLWLFRYRSNLPLIIMFLGLLIYLGTKYFSPTGLFYEEYKFYYEFGCVLVSLLGLWIRVFTVGHSAKNTSGRNVDHQIADSLNTTGIYSLVRHPLYLGNFFMWLGPTLMTGNFWFCISTCLFYWIYYERIMFAEEQFLRKKFGEAYLQWSSTVPAFIPKFTNYRKSEIPFFWKKVMIKEKNGLAATFIIFSVLDVLGELIVKGSNYNYVLIGLTALSILYYFIMRSLRSYTKFFAEVYR